MTRVAHPSSTASIAAAAADVVGDPEATRTVYVSIAALVALGVALVAVAVWLLRATRPEPRVLAPLEEMATRRWRTQDPATRRRMLDDVRPEGARPLRREMRPPTVDAAFASVPPVAGFDDLAPDRIEAHDAARVPPAGASATAADDDPALAPAPAPAPAPARDDDPVRGAATTTEPVADAEAVERDADQVALETDAPSSAVVAEPGALGESRG
ncbi:hypothetical protein [Ilumatobacter sp.]|uniref:hypothetical protein n=1 Tax=Ilumatobacter sp. TaxID=1967498 RepID=UPI003B52A725